MKIKKPKLYPRPEIDQKRKTSRAPKPK